MKDKEKPRNRFKVPKKQWDSWTVIGQLVYNKLYEHMLMYPEFYQSQRNTAFMAAVLTSRGEKHYINDLMKELNVC